jgi:hypothetical protein
MPFKSKEDKNAYQRKYWLEHPDKYEIHKKNCAKYNKNYRPYKSTRGRKLKNDNT